MTKNPKNTVVVVDTIGGEPVYLGELDPGIRQGVRKLENATRFTATGAKRVLAGYSGAYAKSL